MSNITNTNPASKKHVSDAITDHLLSAPHGDGTVVLDASNRVVVTNPSKKLTVSSVTTTELKYLSGVSTNIQNQLDAKASASLVNSHVSDTSAHVTLAEKDNWNSITDHINDTTIHQTLDALETAILNKIYPVGIVVWCKDSSACPKIGTWGVCDALVGRYPLGDSTGGLTPVAAGLPNIKGITLAHGGDASYHNGPFYDTGKNASGNDDSSTGKDSVIGFDASRCSTIYGSSDTVTPPSAKLVPYIRTK